jgi:probable O-glycosylation ligase (exosortase A-associated)
LAFLAILGYALVEYTRLPAMYPILQPLQLGKVVTVLSLLGLLFAPRVRARNPAGVRRVDALVVFFVLACLLSVFAADSVAAFWKGIQDVLLYALIYFLIGRIVSNPWRMRAFLLFWLLLNFKLAQFVIRSYGHYHSIGVSDTALARGTGAGSTGPFANSVDFGIAMCVAWPVGTFLLFATLKKWQRLALVIYSVACLLAIILCSSRGAIVGAVAIVLAALLKQRRRLVPVFMILALLVGIAFIMPGGHKERLRLALNWEQDPNAISRIALWKAGLAMFRDHPFVGVGLGNFPPSYERQYATGEISVKQWVCHSIYIQALSELGLLGALPFLLLLIFLFRLNSHTRKQLAATSPEGHRTLEYSLASGLDLALVGYLASGAFVAVLYYPHLWILLGLSVGLSKACAEKQPGKEVDMELNGRRSLAWQAS